LTDISKYMLSHLGHTWWLVLRIVFGGALGGFGLFLLTLVPPRMRKYVVMGTTFIAGLYFSIEFLIPHESILTRWMPGMTDIQVVVASFAVFLGIGNLFQLHGKTIQRKAENWPNSLAFFVGFFSILAAGLLKDYAHATAVKETGDALFNIFFQGFLVSLQSTMFSLVAFYIVSASYRAFRIKSTETGLMMVAAVVIMLSLVPLGVVITNWIPTEGTFGFLAFLRLERMGPWILANPNMAVQRAIAFGIAVGSLAMGLRIWLSLEKGSFFDKQL